MTKSDLVDGRWRLFPATDLHNRAADWDRVNDGGANSPLLGSTFMRLALQYFGSGRERLAVFESGGQAAALALVVPSRAGSWQTFQPAQAPLGAWVQRSDLDPVRLARALGAALPFGTLAFGITQQDPDLLARPQATDSDPFETQEYYRVARVVFDGTFEEYWAQRGTNLKQNMRRQRNKLAREGTTLSVEVVTDQSLMAAAVDDYGRLESQGWKAQEGTAIHPDNVQGKFYRELMQAHACRGEAVIYRLLFNGKLASCDMCLTRGGLILLKTTHDESQSHVSPTLLLRQEMFTEQFASKSQRSFDFNGKLMDWHAKWATDIRAMYHLTAFRWPWVKRLRRRRSEPRSQDQDGQNGNVGSAPDATTVTPATK